MLKIYKASAGSGKTYTLAYEYIRALLGVKIEDDDHSYYLLCHPKYTPNRLESNRHRFILAITFTNKATEEMKRRITNELDSLTTIVEKGMDSAAYARDLCETYGCTAAELASVATKALRQLLHDYGNFNVATIDSFFQRVLRTFARELERQGDFNVDINDLGAVQTAVGAMIDDFNSAPAEHPTLEKWIYDYMSQRLEDGEKTNFFNRKSYIHTRLVKLVAHICDEKFKPYDAEMRRYLADRRRLPALKKALDQSQKDIIEEIKTTTQEQMQAFAIGGLTVESMRTNASLRRLIPEYFIAGVPVDNPKTIFTDAMAKVRNNTSTSLFLKGKVTAEQSEAFARMVDWISCRYADYFIIKEIKKSIDQLSLLGYAWDYLNDLVAQNNIVLLSDTNNLLSRIIGKDDTPFIYERMGVQLRHFLVDEFQDTSKMQWHNLKPLVANGLSERYDSLIIGDEKQSIYRFRNSDSSLLHTQVPEVDFPPENYGTEIVGDKPGQNTNYRSAADVVRFNNSLFSRLASMLQIEGYENVVQDICKPLRGVTGYVRFIPCVGAEADDDKGPSKKQDPTEMLDSLAEEIIGQHERGYKWSDIAILVSTHKIGAKVVDHLISRYSNIPVLSEESLYVRRSPAVQLVVGVLEIIAGIQSRSTGAKYHVGHDKAEVALAVNRFHYYRGHGMACDEAIDLAVNPEKVSSENAIPAEMLSSINTILERKPSTLCALVETVIHEMVPKHECDLQMSMLSAFQDFVMDYCSRHNPTLRALLNHWDDVKKNLSVSSASDTDAVKVMTIHKSKGLEFACVHIPFGSWKERGKPMGQWLKFPEIPGIDPGLCPPALFLELEGKETILSNEGVYFHQEYIEDKNARMVDTMNMTYVAYTRARRELAVYYDPKAGIGRRIVEACSCSQSIDPEEYRLCDLSESIDTATGRIEVGAPTFKEKDADTCASDVLVMDGYDVYFNQGTEVLTQVEDMLDLERDITDADIDSYSDADEPAPDMEALQRGVILHDILSQVTYLSDIPAAVDSTRRRLRLSKSAADEALALVSEMLNAADARIRRWYDDAADVLTEQSIYVPQNKDDASDRNRRPDRIVVNPDGSIDVVDYKFTSEMYKKHQKQVAEYMDLLRQMGYERISGYLWYPFLQKIVEVGNNT